MREYEVIVKQTDVVKFKNLARNKKEAIAESYYSNGREEYRYAEDTEILSINYIPSQKIKES